MSSQTSFEEQFYHKFMIESYANFALGSLKEEYSCDQDEDCSIIIGKAKAIKEEMESGRRYEFSEAMLQADQGKLREPIEFFAYVLAYLDFLEGEEYLNIARIFQKDVLGSQTSTMEELFEWAKINAESKAVKQVCTIYAMMKDECARRNGRNS
jgi:hypothetical protein